MPFLKSKMRNKKNNLIQNKTTPTKKPKIKRQKIINLRSSKKKEKILKDFLEKKEKKVLPSSKQENNDSNEKSEFLKDTFSEGDLSKIKDRGKQRENIKNKKKISLNDSKGKTVFLQDTGEKLGTVFDMIYDNDKNIIGYKIKDHKTESVLSFPLNQFEESKEGLIYVQSWYLHATKAIEELEFKERVSPELTTLLTKNDISNDELFNIFLKHDDQMANYIEKAISLKERLNKGLMILEEKRHEIKDSLLDLTEEKLIKDDKKKRFSEDFMTHRRKVNILNVNIKKCRGLIDRIDNTSFGKLGESLTFRPGQNPKAPDLYSLNETGCHNKTDEIKNPYKQKYINMKVRFEQLEEDYNDLKSTVERLIKKGEI